MTQFVSRVPEKCEVRLYLSFLTKIQRVMTVVLLISMVFLVLATTPVSILESARAPSAPACVKEVHHSCILAAQLASLLGLQIFHIKTSTLIAALWTTSIWRQDSISKILDIEQNNRET